MTERRNERNLKRRGERKGERKKEREKEREIERKKERKNEKKKERKKERKNTPNQDFSHFLSNLPQINFFTKFDQNWTKMPKLAFWGWLGW